MPSKYFDDLIPGTHFHHPATHTITETENSLFCNLTRNTQPLHLDPEFAKRTQYGQRIVNGLFTLSLVVGLTVPDLTEGTIIANLGYDKLVFPKPVFIGDTLRSESECIDLRESKSRPNAGIVTWAHRSFNQRGELVCECTRSALLLKKPR